MRLRNARDVGALVRDRRREVGLTQQALADLAGVSRRWVAALEGGKAGSELGLVLRVLAVLEVSLRADTPDPDGRSSARSGPDGGADLVDLVDLDALVESYETRPK